MTLDRPLDHIIAEDVELVRLMGRKAADGVTVRLLLGDPDSKHVVHNVALLWASSWRWNSQVQIVT
jgi:hypothetical protein